MPTGAPPFPEEPEAIVDRERSGSSAARGERVVDSAALLRGASQLAIRHREMVYFLRETRFGKLLLTK